MIVHQKSTWKAAFRLIQVSPVRFSFMNQSIATRKKSTAVERTAADDKAERDFDKRVLVRLKRRTPKRLADAAPWSGGKKSLRL